VVVEVDADPAGAVVAVEPGAVVAVVDGVDGVAEPDDEAVVVVVEVAD
jgi:hypothetical protein